MASLPLREPLPALSEPHRRRYARHLLLPEIGEDGQRRLIGSRVLVIGAGGLGSVTATYLAAAGVGVIGIVDDDVVEESNLQRQVIHSTADIGRAKVDSAADRIAALNPLVRVVRHQERIGPANALRLLAAYDLVVDGADNFATRYVVGDAAALVGVPHVWGSILGFDGQVSVWWPPHGPCYRCVFPEPPPPGSVASCAEAGVLGSLCAAIGAIQSGEAVKLITGVGEPLTGRLLVHEALAQTWESVAVSADPACRLCGTERSITRPGEFVVDEGTTRLSVSQLRVLLADPDRDIRVIDVREPAETATGIIAGALTIPLAELDAAALPAAAAYVLYCASGVRSAAGVARLRAAGVVDVTDLDGGISAWRRSEPVATPTGGERGTR